MYDNYEDRDFTFATKADWDRAEARELGSQDPDRPWICTGNDVWHVNPFWGKYDESGNPLSKEAPHKPIRHPEDYDEEYEEDYNEECETVHHCPVIAETDKLNEELMSNEELNI